MIVFSRFFVRIALRSTSNALFLTPFKQKSDEGFSESCYRPNPAGTVFCVYPQFFAAYGCS